MAEAVTFFSENMTGTMLVAQSIFRSSQRSSSMSILAWIVLGLIAGFIGSKIVNKSGEGLILDIVLGIVGAVVGGYLFTLFGAAPVTGLNIYSLLVAIVGAVVVLWVYHLITGSRRI
jgi:uncharacterized membrane protein YeaQ/YmgE (transglycosylase-associated protein family)